jgi:hypothetical protein
MSTLWIERHFAAIGARAKLRPEFGRAPADIKVDIRRDDEGEFFDIACGKRLTIDHLSVVDVQPRLRHLLLMSRSGPANHKFLCGHDERHWFVAAVPERAGASTVRTAFEALRPRAIQFELNRRHVKPAKRNRRRNEVFVRQGEWFFVPAVGFQPEPLLVLRNEPLSRGGKPHWCEELVRTGGELVYVSVQHPQGVTPQQHQRLISRRPEMRHLHWVAQRRNPLVFVRGRVRHADHKTIVLDGWHRVLMNTEHESQAMRHVAFID